MSSVEAGDIIPFSTNSERENENSQKTIEIATNKESDDTDVIRASKILHFCDGTLEECNPNEDEQDGSGESAVDLSTLPWGPWILGQVTNAGSKTLQVVDYVGESLANFFGITTPKYQYEIDEYEIMCAEEEEEKKNEDLEMGGWGEGSSKTIGDQSKSPYSTEVVYDGPIKLQPNTVQS